MRFLARWVVLLVLALTATACGDGGDDGGDDGGGDTPDTLEMTGRMVPVTPSALAAIADQHVDLELERIGTDRRTERTPCGPAYRRVYVEADFVGADLHLTLELGECPGEDVYDYVCGPPPAGADRVSYDLRKCERLRLDDGRIVDSGVSVSYQEGRYHTAVLYAGGLQLTMNTRTDQPELIDLDTLVAIASDPAIGAEVDEAYAAAGGEIEVSPPAAARVPMTGGALLAIAEEHLEATATDVEVERIRPPECPKSYVRWSAQGSFDGRRLGVDVALGECPRGRQGHFDCDGFPDLPGHAVELDACTGRALEDGSSLVTGRLDVYQESSSWLAVRVTSDHVVRVSTSAVPVPELTVEELTGIATAPELGPRVDPAYAARGRELTRG